MTIRTAGQAPPSGSSRSSLLSGEQDESLIRLAEDGNLPAFEKLCSRYDEAILGLLLLLTSSEQDALELCRATFVAAYAGLHRRNVESLYIWIYRQAAAQWLEWASRKAAGASPTRTAAGQLSAREQLVFALKAGQHLALRTVAQILDASEETTARTFSRAVCKLQLSLPKTG